MSSSNEPKLVLHHHEMDCFRDILNLSREHYFNTCAKLSNDGVFLTELSLNRIKLLHIDKIYNKVLQELEFGYYIYKFSIDLEGCLHLLSAILPVDNLEWYVKTRNIVFEYCVAVLKINDVIPNMPTFKPALPDLKAEFVNPTTQLWEYLED